MGGVETTEGREEHTSLAGLAMSENAGTDIVAVGGIGRYKSQRKVVMKMKLEFRQRCERNEWGRRVGDDGAYLGTYLLENTWDQTHTGLISYTGVSCWGTPLEPAQAQCIAREALVYQALKLPCAPPSKEFAHG